MVKSAFKKCILLQKFLLINWILEKKFNLLIFCRFLRWRIRTFQYCIICHIWTSNMTFRGGGGQIQKLTPPPSVHLGFQDPNRNRIKIAQKLLLFKPLKNGFINTCLNRVNIEFKTEVFFLILVFQGVNNHL